MAFIIKKATLGKLSVQDAMRRQVIGISQKAAIDRCIRYMIKYKVNAVLAVDGKNNPRGVVSKTDIMSAYYARLPVDIPVENIMSTPPLFCRADDSLDAALFQMRSNSIYRIYVLAPNRGHVMGVLAYPDIVGLLYRYCHACEYSRLYNHKKNSGAKTIVRYRVKDVMSQPVKSFIKTASLDQVMEGLSALGFGAVLITTIHNVPVGVISKTDLALAYRHGISPETAADTIMSRPVYACEEDEYLEDAIRKMIFSEVQRLFAYKKTPQDIIGVLSLSDAARLRSGSCQACVVSRIEIGASA